MTVLHLACASRFSMTASTTKGHGTLLSPATTIGLDSSFTPNSAKLGSVRFTSFNKAEYQSQAQLFWTSDKTTASHNYYSHLGYHTGMHTLVYIRVYDKGDAQVWEVEGVYL